MPTRARIVDALRNVYDPEIGMNIVDLGLVYGVEVDDAAAKVRVTFTLTSPGCPLAPQLIRDIERELTALDDVGEVSVELVWSPVWQPTMMSDYAKDELGYDEEMGLTYRAP